MKAKYTYSAKGRYCQCGRKAIKTKWGHNFVCERCDRIENNMYKISGRKYKKA